MKRETTETFIEKARKVHEDKYDYSETEYGRNSTEKVVIICKEHGRFLLRAGKHLEGRGCRECTKEHLRTINGKSQVEYLEELREILSSTGDLENYDLSQVNYVNAKTKIIITCKKHTHTWGITPGHLRHGQRCPHCRLEFLYKILAHTTSWFIEESERVYGKDTYIYDKVNYLNNREKVTIYCKHHGYFETNPEKWLSRKHGCPQCHKVTLIPHNKKFSPQLVLEGKDIHGDKYDYSKLDDTKNSREKQEVICPKHGSWFVSMDNHLNAKSGCPSCTNVVSIAEREVGKFITELGYTFIANQPILKPYHIDIYIPELKFGIEYCGIYYHGELRNQDNQYHLKKFLLAKEQGIYLLQIFEDEWVFSTEIVKQVLQTKLGKSTNRYYARKLNLVKITSSEANAFFKRTHLQGSTGSISNAYGLLDKDKQLKGVMAFTPANVKSGKIELCRFATEGNVLGGFSKLFKRACMDLKALGYSEIISYSDNRWSKGDIYRSIGFIDQGITSPRYWWCKNQNRFHRRGFQRKYLRKIFRGSFKEELSEAENCRANGYFKIWDAGITRWSYSL